MKKLIIPALLIFIGYASQAAHKKPNQHPPTIDQIMKDLDANKDGKISKAEAKGPLKNEFDKVDTNKDGYLSKAELKKAPRPKKLPKKK